MELPAKERLTGADSPMKKKRFNIGGVDRTIRGILGISLMFAGLFLFD
ncbi:MAG: hypothetical protein HY202_08765, partial [Nitrospirae bacterium]|nr:hypothetical protein [Nitrospirota bacterium]